MVVVGRSQQYGAPRMIPQPVGHTYSPRCECIACVRLRTAPRGPWHPWCAIGGFRWIPFRVTTPWLQLEVTRVLMEQMRRDSVKKTSIEAVVAFMNFRPEWTRRTSRPSRLDGVISQLHLWLGPKLFVPGKQGEIDAAAAVKGSVLLGSALRSW
jgi:hypothetical protein